MGGGGHGEFLYTACMSSPLPSIARRIEIAESLFAGWSSGDPDAPEPYFTPDGVLDDVASGRFEGWPAIRDFFAAGHATHLRFDVDPR